MSTSCKYTFLLIHTDSLSTHVAVQNISQEPIWYEDDSQWFHFYLFFSCHIWCPHPPHPASLSCLLGNKVISLPTANTIWAPEGPAWSTNPPPPPRQIHHQWIHSANEFSPVPTDHRRCYEIVDDPSARGTLTEYLCGGQGQHCYKGMRQPSLM